MSGDTGNDRLTDNRGRDVFDGGSGTDRINSRDVTRANRRQRDTVRCGTGRRDVAHVDRRDNVSRDCERVFRRSI
jgi:Ca2+-binding RTX toxin-like protein